MNKEITNSHHSKKSSNPITSLCVTIISLLVIMLLSYLLPAKILFVFGIILIALNVALFFSNNNTKQNDSVIRCSCCGTNNPVYFSYCPSCGKRNIEQQKKSKSEMEQQVIQEDIDKLYESDTVLEAKISEDTEVVDDDSFKLNSSHMQFDDCFDDEF